MHPDHDAGTSLPSQAGSRSGGMEGGRGTSCHGVATSMLSDDESDGGVDAAVAVHPARPAPAKLCPRQGAADVVGRSKDTPLATNRPQGPLFDVSRHCSDPSGVAASTTPCIGSPPDDCYSAWLECVAHRRGRWLADRGLRAFARIPDVATDLRRSKVGSVVRAQAQKPRRSSFLHDALRPERHDAAAAGGCRCLAIFRRRVLIWWTTRAYHATHGSCLARCVTTAAPPATRVSRLTG